MTGVREGDEVEVTLKGTATYVENEYFELNDNYCFSPKDGLVSVKVTKRSLLKAGDVIDGRLNLNSLPIGSLIEYTGPAARGAAVTALWVRIGGGWLLVREATPPSRETGFVSKSLDGVGWTVRFIPEESK